LDIQILSVMKLLRLILPVICLVSCLKTEPETAAPCKHIVVEGRIEQGRGAEVMLTLNRGFSQSFSEEQLQDIVVRWAKVTVCDGEQQEVLTGRYNRDYPTRFIYTGTMIRGMAGRTYSLEIEYGGARWSAETTIPEVAERLESIGAEWVSDSLYRITAAIAPSAEQNSYMIECSIKGQGNFYRPALFGIMNGAGQTASRTMTVNRPIDYTRITSYTTLFRRSDTVRVRLLTMSDFGYDYWSMWENNVINSLNPIFPADKNLPTNISGDATGIWCGYGAAYYTVSPPAR